MTAPPAWGTGPDQRPAGRPSERVRDVLRLEAFGGLFWPRSTQQFSALADPLTRLLLDARERSVLDLLALEPDRLPGDDRAVAREVAAWQQEGYIGADFLCRARVVANPPVRGALTAPLSTALFITRGCNLRCAHCFVSTGSRAHEPITVAMVDALCADLVDLGCPHLIVAGGEPMVRRDFWEVIETIASHELAVMLCTNGTLVTEDAARRLAGLELSKISVSLDGPDAASHDAVRGEGAFERAADGIRALVTAGAFVQMRVTVTPHILDRLREFGHLANELRVDVLDIKPFKATGAAGDTRHLVVPVDSYRRAVDEAAQDWPDGPCDVRIGDGMPTRLPDWTGAMAPFSCNGGTTRLTVLGDGRVVACGAVTANDDWNLADHGIADCWRNAPSVTRWRTLEAGDTCSCCSLLSTCGGGCRARALGAGLEWGDRDPWAPCPDPD